MIVTLSGLVSEKLGDLVVLDVAGIGYGLLVTNEDFGALSKGEKAKVYVYEHIRETAHDLFGFVTLETRELFERLLGVNGIGPRMALNILRIGKPADVKSAIANGDVKFIQQASGVGKRIAERAIVELKDKVGLPGLDLQSAGLLQGEAVVLKDDAAKGLVSLGYSPSDALTALKDIDSGLPTEERIRLALKGSNS
jgi:Holliday junction DNA helicase RuvA